MKTHTFTVVASGPDPHNLAYADRFFEAGCDDATVSLQKGRFVLEFDRKAKTLEKALLSAIRDVRKAGAVVERVEPDHLVNASDIAARTGLTRSAVSLIAAGKRGSGFPAPIARVTTDSPLWDWADVARWMWKHDKVSENVAIEAASIRTANAAIARGHDPVSDLQREFSSSLVA